MKNVVIAPVLQWEFLTQLPQQMALQFAKNGYNVYFLNNNLDQGKFRINDNLIVYNNYEEFVNEVKNGQIKVDIFYNTWAKRHDMVEMLKPKTTIYHSCDTFQEWEEFEPLMLKKSDIVLCTAQSIFDLRKKQHDNVHLVRNGCNIEMITSPWKQPAEMEHDKKSTIFIGAVGKWVRTSVMKKVADKHLTYFVGKEFGKNIPTNIKWLGMKPHNDLVNYYNAATIGLLPFNINSNITLGANPIKLWEYLACGKPVVATAWPETELLELKEVVYTAKNDDEFVRRVDNLINLNQSELDELSAKAKVIALSNTWESRFKQLQKILSE